jgi:hypothetical protein
VSQAERNARLDALRKATENWAAKRTKQYTDRIAINKAILQGRTGAPRLADSNVRAYSALVVTAIDDFLLT